MARNTIEMARKRNLNVNTKKAEQSIHVINLSTYTKPEVYESKKMTGLNMVMTIIIFSI